MFKFLKKLFSKKPKVKYSYNCNTCNLPKSFCKDCTYGYNKSQN